MRLTVKKLYQMKRTVVEGGGTQSSIVIQRNVQKECNLMKIKKEQYKKADYKKADSGSGLLMIFAKW